MSAAGRSGTESSLARSSSPRSAIKFSVTSCYSRADEVDPVDADLKVFHRHEKRVYALNDQVVALGRVINEGANGNELAKNDVRKQKIRILQAQKAIEERKAQLSLHVDEYRDAVERQRLGKIEQEAAKGELAKVHEALISMSGHLQDVLDNPSTATIIRGDARAEIVESLAQTNALFDAVKQRKEKLEHDLKESTQRGKVLAAREKKLISQRARLEEERDSLVEKSENASVGLNTPCDELIAENAFVEALESEADELERRNETTIEQKLAEDVIAARTKCEAYVIAQAKRRAFLRQQQEKLAQDIGESSKAAGSAVGSSATTRAASVASAMASIQSKLANDTVTKVFKDLEDKQEQLEASIAAIAVVEQTNRGGRAIVEEDWKKKMASIEKTTGELAQFETLVIQLAAARERSVDLRQELLDEERDIRRLHVANASSASVRDDNDKRRQTLEPVKSRIAAKDAEIAAKESELGALRERVASARRDYDWRNGEVIAQQHRTRDAEAEAVTKRETAELLAYEVDGRFGAQTTANVLGKVTTP